MLTTKGVNADTYRMVFQAGVDITGAEEQKYDFNSKKFTNCGNSGRSGPSLSNCLSSYQSNWVENEAFFNINEEKQGGGGSYNDGKNQQNSSAYNNDHGYVEIDFIN